MFPTEYPEFTTVTCLDWRPILEHDREKEIVIESMRFLVNHERVSIFAFVLMSTHFHMIWQMNWGYTRDAEQRNMLKYTGQQMIKNFRNEKSSMLDELLVEAKDRRYQIWERNSLSMNLQVPGLPEAVKRNTLRLLQPLWSSKVIDQKLEYIHMNPVKAGLCEFPEDYKYSSARYYVLNEKNWDFLTHIDG